MSLRLPHVVSTFFEQISHVPAGGAIIVVKEVLEENRYGKIIAVEAEDGSFMHYFVGKQDGQLLVSQE
jgi:hypothetical protein